MEIFCDLHIKIDLDRMAAMADLIERTPPAGWTRDRFMEENAQKAPALNSRATFCFRCSQEGKRPEAMVILIQKDAMTFFVSNIIPLAQHQLAHAEYNMILEEFYQRAILPYMGSEGATANLSNGQVDLEYWMSHETAELLRRFSASANRGTGAAHPKDREHWNAFVVAAHRDGSKIEASDLRRWLNEVDGWPCEVADLLALEYEYGRELLAYAEEPRRSA